jgi:acylphosphatase
MQVIPGFLWLKRAKPPKGVSLENNPLDIPNIIRIHKNMQRIHIRIRGIVQGVGFRYFTVRKARESGISGWVRNTPDGGVEIVAEGEKWQLEEFTKNVKIGPSLSSVTGMEVKEEEYQDEFEGFEVRF